MSTVDPRNPLMMPDIFYVVLDCFRPACDPGAGRALAALAQTCRAFSEPSLNHLWGNLHSLEPLLRCYAGAGDAENMLPPTPSEYAIIDRYSHRIRKLTVCGSASLRFLQCTSMRPFCLLPNLTILEWNPFGHVPHIPIILIQRLLNPILVSLKATFIEADGVILLSFLDSLPLLCPRLKSLDFPCSVVSQSPTTIRAFSRLICSQMSLEKVILHSPIDDCALKHLSTMPSLKVLHIGLSELSRPRNPSFLPSEPLLRSVEELGIETSDLDLVISFLLPRGQIFHSFYLDYLNRMTSEAATALLNLLESRSRTRPFQKFTLQSGAPLPLTPDQMATEAPRYRLSYETIQPLMVFESLRFLTIWWGEQISLDDEELTKLARGWPLLQVFYFYCGRGGYHPFLAKYPTLRGLLSLVASCPELNLISLPLDATQVQEVKEAEPRQTNFTRLTIPESPIDQAIPVAEFLFKYLPCVTMLRWRFARPPGTDIAQIKAYEQAWDQAETHLNWLQGL